MLHMVSNKQVKDFLLFQLNELENYCQVIERMDKEEPIYCMVWAKKADIEVDMTFGEVFVKSGSVLFPNYQQLLSLVGTKIEGTVLCVCYSFISNPLRAKLLKLVINLRELRIVQMVSDPSPQIGRYFDMIFNEFNRTDSEHHSTIFENLSAILFLTVHKSHFNYASDLTYSIQIDNTLNFLDLLDENYTSKKNVAWYAEQLGVTEKQLNESVKKVVSFAPKSLIKKRTIVEAKEMLVMTQDNLTKISLQLGFNEVSYFIKYFIHNTGYQPKQFRDEYSKILY